MIGFPKRTVGAGRRMSDAECDEWLLKLHTVDMKRSVLAQKWPGGLPVFIWNTSHARISNTSRLPDCYRLMLDTIEPNNSVPVISGASVADAYLLKVLRRMGVKLSNLEVLGVGERVSTTYGEGVVVAGGAVSGDGMVKIQLPFGFATMHESMIQRAHKSVRVVVPYNRRFYIGLDCEWHPYRRNAKVALLQLCLRLESERPCIKGPKTEIVILRLSEMEEIGPTLRNLLGCSAILKVGVGIEEDRRRLENDYKLSCAGFCDMSKLAVTMGYPKGMSLKNLTKKTSGVYLPKKKVQVSNWERKHLTPAQILYASADAFYSADIYKHLVINAKHTKTSGSDPGLPNHVRWAIDAMSCLPASSTEKKKSLKGGKRSMSIEEKLKQRASRYEKMNFGLLERPLYENCRVLHPDGFLMFTCNWRKVIFYLKKGLAKRVIVKPTPDNPNPPVTIQLTFQPKGSGNNGNKYFCDVRKNECVICGATQRLQRHQVIPYAYRQFFPQSIKNHSSHDIVLTCNVCNAKANMFNEEFKLTISKRYEVPLDSKQSTSSDGDSKKSDGLITSRDAVGAAKTLRRHGHQIRENVPEKYEELLKIVSSYLKQLDLQTKSSFSKAPSESDDVVQFSPSWDSQGGSGEGEWSLDVSALELDRILALEKKKRKKDKTKSHGYLLVAEVLKRGPKELHQFQRMWRQHFLDTMRPRYLSEHWSVDHIKENDIRLYDDGSTVEAFSVT